MSTSSPSESAPRCYNRGLDFAAEGRLKEAEKELLKASELDWSDADALCELGRIKIETGQLAEAVTFLKKALSRVPHHAGSLNNMGVTAFLSGNYSKAAEYFRSALNSNPNLADAWYNLADTCEELGDIQEKRMAERRYRELTG